MGWRSLGLQAASSLVLVDRLSASPTTLWVEQQQHQPHETGATLITEPAEPVLPRVDLLAQAQEAYAKGDFSACDLSFTQFGEIRELEDAIMAGVCKIETGSVLHGLNLFTYVLNSRLSTPQTFVPFLQRLPAEKGPEWYFQTVRALQLSGSPDLALEAELMSLRVAIAVEGPKFGLWPVARPVGALSIIIFAHLWNEVTWGPSNLTSGLGGSEESIVHLSRALAGAGVWVEVYGPFPFNERGRDKFGVLWLPWQVYDPLQPCTAFIAWRNTAALFLPTAAERVYIWLHDVAPADMFPAAVQARLGNEKVKPPRSGGIIVVSDFHKRALPADVQKLALVAGNGVDDNTMEMGEAAEKESSQRCNTCLIYASSPFRGLELVLQAWPQIRAAVPEATLDVYYGFPPYMEGALRNNPELQQRREAMEEGLKQDGITYHGSVGSVALRQANLDAGMYVYPSCYAETFCISLARAQVLGAIPITSRHLFSALSEVAGQFDLGPPSPLSWLGADGVPDPGYKCIAANESLREEWTLAVVQAMRSDSVVLGKHRHEMMRWARSQFKWRDIAKKWIGWMTPDTWGGRSILQPPPLYIKEEQCIYLPVIAYGGMVAVDFSSSMTNLALMAKDLGLVLHIDDKHGESLIPRARNMATARFLSQTNCSHMMFVDTDIGFDARDVFIMFNLRKDVIAAPYPLKTLDMAWSVNGKFLQTDTPGLYMGEWLSTGFMMISRRALNRIVIAEPGRVYRNNMPSYGLTSAYDYFPAGVDESGLYQSEDYGFSGICQRVGIDLFIYGNATLRHHGRSAYAANFFDWIQSDGKNRTWIQGK